MKEWLNTFLSELHRTHLKPRGFRKSGRTFSLDRGMYHLRVHFQGSDSNGLYSTWKFYINTGVEFKDLEPEPYGSYLAHTHWAARIESVVAGSPHDWRYNLDTDRDALAAELAELIGEATENVAADIECIRSEFLVKKAARQARHDNHCA